MRLDNSRKYALIGKKLGHSYSVSVHNALGIDNYVLKELAPDELENFMRQGYDGFNVTIPYKSAVIPYLDYVEETARVIGAVNTVVRNKGKYYGYNTDANGLRHMLNRADADVRGSSVMILGSGGTSRTAQYVLSDMGAERITVVSRGGSCNYANYGDCCADIVINTTPCGMYPDNAASPIDLSRIRGVKYVIDCIYNPLKTQLLLQAKHMGLKYSGGLAMLIAQAVYANSLFTGVERTEDVIERVYGKIIDGIRNIVLVGMPGSGKSSVGKAVAEKLGKNFYDTDLIVESSVNSTISRYIDAMGEAAFREKEREAVLSLENVKGAVIATGGGTLLNEKNRAVLEKNGEIIYLDRPLDDLATKDRPLSRNKTALKELYNARSDIYKQTADFTLKVAGNVKDCANAILEIISSN